MTGLTRGRATSEDEGGTAAGDGEGDAAEVCNSPYSFNVISNILRIGNFEHREHREQREQRGGAPVAASS